MHFLQEFVFPVSVRTIWMDVSRLRKEYDERDAQESEYPVDVPDFPPDVLGGEGDLDDSVWHEETGQTADIARLVQLADGLGRAPAAEPGDAGVLLGEHDGALPLAVVDDGAGEAGGVDGALDQLGSRQPRQVHHGADEWTTKVRLNGP